MPKKLTKEIFIQRALIIHGSEYNYDSVDYKTNRDKVIITCQTHGDFLVTPDSHLSGRKCPYCAKTNRANKNRASKEDFIKKCVDVHGDTYDYSKVDYVSNKIRVIVTCKIHGDFTIRPDAHISQKSGCPNCGRERTTKASIKHGLRYENTYNNWKAMMSRCYGNEETKNGAYKQKNITVEPFLQDMTNYHNYVITLPNYELKEQMNLTIDRIDGNKGYERGNLRWATKSEQSSNRAEVKGRYIGIGENKGNWYFKIEFMGKNYYKSGFPTLEAALSARNEYIEKHNLPHKIQK